MYKYDSVVITGVTGKEVRALQKKKKKKPVNTVKARVAFPF